MTDADAEQESVGVLGRDAWYERATSAASLVHKLTIAVATTMLVVASSARSTRLRSATARRPSPSQAVV
jgi:hypothetical protein